MVGESRSLPTRRGSTSTGRPSRAWRSCSRTFSKAWRRRSAPDFSYISGHGREPVLPPPLRRVAQDHRRGDRPTARSGFITRSDTGPTTGGRRRVETFDPAKAAAWAEDRGARRRLAAPVVRDACRRA
ncbi:MAG: hypothetical protein MZW92_03065 [Comamonadaceae bacterium]|nr:hypothetical protein [Comamonadaceae bacterium]